MTNRHFELALGRRDSSFLPKTVDRKAESGKRKAESVIHFCIFLKFQKYFGSTY